MTSCDIDPVLKSFFDLDSPVMDNVSNQHPIAGVYHDRLVNLGKSVYCDGKSSNLGLDVVRTDPNGRVVIDTVHQAFFSSMEENGIGIRLIGGFKYYEGMEAVPSANILDFQMEGNSLKVQRIVRSIADTLVIAAAFNLPRDYYLSRITNLGLLITDDFNNYHLLFAPVLNGENRISTTTLHGAIFLLIGNAQDRFYIHKNSMGRLIKSILKRQYPYSSLLSLAEEKGLIL